MYFKIRLKGPNTQHILVKKNPTELMLETYSKSPVRAIGKVLVMKFSWNSN